MSSTPSGALRVAVWQCRSRPLEVSANLDRLAEACGRAAEEGADVLVTPELFVTGYEISGDDTRRLAEPLDGATFRTVCEISRGTGVAVAYGFPEAASDPGGDQDVVHNAMQVVDGDERVLSHRKLHLFASIDRDRFAAGTSAPEVGSLRGQVVAGLVCYDVEFPESVRSAAVQGATLVLVPTANPVGYEPVSTLLVPSRAYENGVHVAYANFVGTEGRTTYAGLSVIAAPDGESVVASATDEALLVHELGLPTRRVPRYLRDRRTDLW